MPNKKNVTVKILLLLLLSDILETFIHFCFKKSVLTQADFMVRTLSDAFTFSKAAFSSPFMWAGLMAVAVIFIVWSTILSKIDLSVAIPIASFSYIFVPLTSLIFLHEKISALRWSGIFMILAGVILVFLSSHNKKSGFL